jgi:Tfp pilus assembly protein PilF
VIVVLSVLLWPVLHAAAQPEREKARIDGFLANEASVGERVRAYDRLHQKLADIHARRAELLEKSEDKEGEVRQANAELMLARHAYEIALQRYPGHARLHNYYGELLYDRFEEREKGVTEWKKALELDETQSRACNNLGIHLCHIGKYAEGLANLDRAVMLEPDNADYQYNLAQIYLAHWPQVMEIRRWTAGKLYAAAMTASKTAAKCAPKDYDLAADYARNFFIAEQMEIAPDWEGAAKAWQQVRKLARNEEEEFNAWLNEGRVWFKAGKGGKAVKCCEEALKIRPQSLVAKELMSLAKEPNRKQSGK